MATPDDSATIAYDVNSTVPMFCLQNTSTLSPSLAALCPGLCYNGSCNGTADPDLQKGNPFIMEWYQQLIYIVLFVSMVIVAAGGNLIVIWIVLAHKRMRTVTNYFLVNLAIADALISILNTLFNFAYMLHSHWPFGRGYCKFSTFIANCTIAASVFTFMAISIDRYMAIIHPLRPRMGARLVLAVVAGIWIASSVVAFPNLVYSETHTWHFKDGDYRTICFMDWPGGVYSTVDFAYNIFYMLVTYFAPLMALGFTYVRVGMELWGSQAIGERTVGQVENVKAKRRVVKMLIIVVVIFGLCWLPQHVYFLLTNQHQYINKGDYAQHIYLVIYWLAMSNSMYNPIIYCWMNARFRRGFKRVFRWLPCVKFQPEDIHGTKASHIIGRVSMTDNTKYGGYEPNGSMSHTCIETLEEHSISATSVMISHGRGMHAKRVQEDTL